LVSMSTLLSLITDNSGGADATVTITDE
jgi:hypothetical protein